MPLRDHFHSPVNDKHRWDAVHGQWPYPAILRVLDQDDENPDQYLEYLD